MTLLERLKEKRELRKIWNAKPVKRKPLTAAQKAKNKESADGWATALNNALKHEAHTVDQQIKAHRVETMKIMFGMYPECFVNVSEVIIHTPNGGKIRGTENVFKFASKQSSTSND